MIRTKVLLNFMAIICFSFLGCNSPDYCNTLVDHLHTNVHKDLYEVDLVDVYPFEWDLLYIIDGDIYPDEVSQILGIDCKCKYISSANSFIFFINDSVIVNKYVSYCYQTRYVGLSYDGIIKIDSKSAKFKVKLDEIDGEDIYKLFSQ